ncbi:PREDICTED: protein L-Myc [Gavialis gangeticus]|uniref:protein L-Myc n=1 Tax=Gavialis gangeticus TaxID=94835 RepID=UPI00092E6A00|nr:PREDICTED: protein L-Myc [Gavialis gangeticus]
MELDSYHHYFYDHDSEEDFYRSTAPSEDIWKKFELVPTPPTSPACGPADKASCCSGAAGERGDWLPGCCLAGEEPGEIFANLSAFILQDCMWSGFSARERLEKARSEKLSVPGVPRLAPHKPSFAQDLGFGHAATECVDPAAVFPCPLAESKIPASSGSESQSDSEGEEIDVVTVEKRQSLNLRKPVTITVRADPLDPCMKHFHISIHQQQHNYAARSPPDPCSQEEAEKVIKVEPVSSPEEVAESSESSSPEPCLLKTSSSAPNSDSEDMAKRKNHNYLERKRRNDLRSRFLALRDQVPGLANCPKTPKVVILSKASEYLQSLVSAERRLAAEKRQLKARQQQLLKRISQLEGH